LCFPLPKFQVSTARDGLLLIFELSDLRDKASIIFFLLGELSHSLENFLLDGIFVVSPSLT